MERHERAGKDRGGLWHWLVVLGVSAGVLAWGMIQYAVVKDSPREWNYGTLPETPGSSIYSTQEPGKGAPAPPAMAPLPESRPETESGGGR